MEYRDFLSLTNEEVKQIVTDIFAAKKVTNIKRSKKNDNITCTVYTEWTGTDTGNITTISDEIMLCNPFNYGEDAIGAPFQLTSDDYGKLKSFCYAKGIYGASIDWLINNPYMRKENVDE